MTSKADFTDQEWELVREGPPTAGMVTLLASSGGTFRETWALAKTFAEARQQHGESDLLDALVAEANALADRLRKARYTAVRRERNELADQLVNDALDSA